MEDWYILKRIKAKNLKLALKNESEAVLLNVYKEDDEPKEEKEKDVRGFKS